MRGEEHPAGLVLGVQGTPDVDLQPVVGQPLGDASAPFDQGDRVGQGRLQVEVFEFVDGETFSVYFMTRYRPQTVLRLRHKATRREFYVINMHTSAGHGGRYASTRNAAFGTAVSVVNRLKAERIPIFLTGDMNDRANFYCRVIPPTGMVAAQGGGGTCGTPPRMRPVDWIAGHGRVAFSGYVDDFSSESRRVSDHPFVSATATMRGSGD